MGRLPKKPLNPVHEFFPAESAGSHSPFNKMVDVDGSEVDTSKPGMSNAGKYKGVHEFAGPHGTYPINTKERAESAIKLAHNAADPEQIKENVYKKYPSLEPDNKSKNA